MGVTVVGSARYVRQRGVASATVRMLSTNISVDFVWLRGILPSITE